MADIKALLGDLYKEGMALDEINAALLTRDFVDTSELTKYVSKETADKYASEAADYKKKYNSKLTEDEKKASESKAAQDELVAKYESVLKENQITKNVAKFLGLGYSDELARKTAEALSSGDMDTVFANQATFNTLQKAEIKAELLKATPAPRAGGNADNKIDYKKEIEKAQLNQEYLKAAYYTRLAGQAEKEKEQ